MVVCCQISFLKTCITQNFDFLFLFGWILIFSFFYNFSKFCLFWTRTSQGRPWFKCKSKIFTKSGTSQGRPWLKFHRIFQVGKKSFFLKNIFFFVFYGCLSFFNEKYRYFATFDQQILAEKLVFRILQHRFSRGSAISKMIVKKIRKGRFLRPSPSWKVRSRYTPPKNLQTHLLHCRKTRNIARKNQKPTRKIHFFL